VKEVPDMEKTLDLGWFIVITPTSRVCQLRVSAAMDLGAFARFEAAGSS
jgi:hypothetical protein